MSCLETNGSTQKTEKKTKRLECGKARKTGQSNLRYKFFHTRAIARYQDSDEVWQKTFFFHHGQSCLEEPKLTLPTGNMTDLQKRPRVQKQGQS